jgi:F-type H+-transporting ATPase subunit alpha
MIYAVVNNYLKDIPVNMVREFEVDLLKEIEESHPDIYSSITQTKELTAENEEAIKEVLKNYVEKFLKSK